jgi:polysaccharide export outer membrane protein
MALAGCGSTPSFGPNVREIVDESHAAKRYGFVLVNVDAPVLRALGAVPRGTLRDVFPDDRRVVPRLGPGDVLSISVYESGAGELFAPPTAQQLSYGTSNITLPAVTVAPNGSITVPFASVLEVSGLTPLEVQDLIRRHLGGKSVQPQVMVSVTKDVTNVATVTGSVRNPGRYAITAASETLMQLVAEAGGATQQASDTVLQLTRHGRQVSVRLSDLLSFPQQDIHAFPGDYVNLVQEPRDFLVYGAVYKSGAYSLPSGSVTLTEAISHAGGMVDTIADSRGVFVFRYGMLAQTPLDLNMA